MQFLYTNIIGTFVLDDKLNIQDKIEFQSYRDFLKKEKFEEILHKKHSQLKLLPQEKLGSALALFKKKEFFSLFYKHNVELTKINIKDSVSEDQLIMQTIANISELDRVTNTLVKRLREWYSLTLPEISQEITSHERFVEEVLSKSREDLLETIKTQTMGAHLENVDILEMKRLAEEVQHLYNLRIEHEAYLEKVMEKYCPNVLRLAGATIGAKLLELAKSLKHMASLPASTIQLLGAEKALFRHIKTGARSPKYGVIFQHPLIQRASRENRGKAARALADKLSLCARLDYFKGEFKAETYKKDLEEKFLK